MRTRTIAFSLAALLVAAAGATIGSTAHASEAPAPACRPNVTFENDDVRIWFHTLTGFVKIHDKADSSGEQGMYFFKSRAIVELDEEEVVRTMNIERAFPGSADCTITEEREFVNMTITFTGIVRDVRGPPVGTATVTQAWSFNTSALGAKFDLAIDGWPWAADAEDHTLAYDFRMTAGSLELEPAENGVGVRDEEGQAQGYVEWAQNFNVTYADESEDEGDVVASWDGNAHHLELRLAFTDVDGGYVALDYDPWMGVGDYVIVAGRLIGLAPLEALLPPPAGRVVRGAI